MHTQLYGSGFHSRPGFMDAVTIAVAPEPLQKTAAANIMGKHPRAGNSRNYCGGSNFSSRSGKSSGTKSNSSKFIQSSRSSRSIYSSRGSREGKSRREQCHNNGGHDDYSNSPASQCPTEKIFDYRYGSSNNDNGSTARQQENNYLGPDLARPHGGHNYQTPGHESPRRSPSPTRTKRSQPRSISPWKEHVPVPLDQSPHFTLVDLKQKQPQKQPRPSSPPFFTSMLKYLKLSSSQNRKAKRPHLDQDVTDGHRYQTRSEVSYAPERDPMYKGIPRQPGQRVEGEVVVHRRRPYESREQGGSGSQPKPYVSKSYENSRRDTIHSSRSEPLPHERGSNGNHCSRQVRSHEVLRKDSGQNLSHESLGQGRDGCWSNQTLSRESRGRRSASSSHSRSPRPHETHRQGSSSGSHRSKPKSHESMSHGSGGSSNSTKARSRSRLRRGSAGSNHGSDVRPQETQNEGHPPAVGARCEAEVPYPDDDDRSALFPTLSEMGMVRRVDGKGIPTRPVAPEDSISSIGHKRRRDREHQRAARSKFIELLRQRDIEEEKREAE